MNNRRIIGLATALIVSLLVVASFGPVQSAITFGLWRDINPTQYTADVTGTLRGTYVRVGGTGSIGAGDGWAVGGDSSTPIISHYDGFSWQLKGSPIASAVYDGVHFCTSPGAPSVGLCSANGDGTDGWIVGEGSVGYGITAAAVYVQTSSILIPKSNGLSTSAGSELFSVFMVCHSPAYSSGCPGGLSAGLTYAVGTDGTHGVIYVFNGDPSTSGAWSLYFTSSHTSQFNSVYMYWTGSTLEGFAVGNGGWVARLSSGGWTESQPDGVDLMGVFVDNIISGSPDAWAVGKSGHVLHFTTGIWGGPMTPYGTSNDLLGLFLTSTSNGWIVGTHSTILWSTTLDSGGAWSALTSPLQTGTGSGIDLLGTSFPGGSNGWAIGTKGVILHTDNSNCISSGVVPAPCWGGSTSIVQVELKAVFEKGSSDAWAGGLFDTASNAPSLIHWDGSKWHRASVSPGYSAPQPNIWGIYMLSSSEGWAVGGNSGDTAPAALKWNGNSWTAVIPAPCSCGLRSVFMVSGGTGGEGWAVGTGGNIFRYTSGSWQLFNTIAGNPQLNSVFISNPGNNLNAGWAVGNGGTVLKLSITGGSPTWNVIGPLNSGTLVADLYAVYFTDSTHGWIVGGTSGGQEAVIMTTTDGNTWVGGASQVTGATPGTVLRSVFIDTYGTVSGNGDGWAVGDDNNGNAVFAHWDGGNFLATTISPALKAGAITFGMGLRSVYLTSPTDGFTVGTGIAGAASPLSSIFHLDPPNPPVYQGATTTTTQGGGNNGGVSTTTSTTPSSTTTAASSSTAAASVTTTSQTSSSSATATGSTQTGAVTATQTGPTSSSTSRITSVQTPLQFPAIPGFPWESILAGITLGLTALAVARRRRARRLAT